MLKSTGQLFEKEAFAIYQAFKKLDYLFYDDAPAHVFTDHRNFTLCLCPLVVVVPGLRRHTVGKVLRWALSLSKVPYVIEHIEGERNVFADILTRWLREYRVKKQGSKNRQTCLHRWVLWNLRRLTPSPGLT